TEVVRMRGWRTMRVSKSSYCTRVARATRAAVSPVESAITWIAIGASLPMATQYGQNGVLRPRWGDQPGESSPNETLVLVCHGGRLVGQGGRLVGQGGRLVGPVGSLV